jgi:hypothetical protein
VVVVTSDVSKDAIPVSVAAAKNIRICTGQSYISGEYPWEQKGGQVDRECCVTRHTSHVTRHTSHVTRHTSHDKPLQKVGLSVQNEDTAVAAEACVTANEGSSHVQGENLCKYRL